MGRQICVCLSSSNPVDRYNLADRPFQRSGNSPAQTSASLHPPAALRLRVLPFTRTWSSTVCAGELPLRGRPCMEENAAASGSCYWLGAPMRIGKGRRGRPWEAGIATSAGKESNLPEGSSFGKRLPEGSTIGKQLPAGVIGRMV